MMRDVFTFIVAARRARASRSPACRLQHVGRPDRNLFQMDDYQSLIRAATTSPSSAFRPTPHQPPPLAQLIIA